MGLLPVLQFKGLQERAHAQDINRVLKNPVHRPVKKVPAARLRRELSRVAREKSTRVGVLRQYVGATPFEVETIPAAIERSYHKRLLRAGRWQVDHFQRSD